MLILVELRAESTENENKRARVTATFEIAMEESEEKIKEESTEISSTVMGSMGNLYGWKKGNNELKGGTEAQMAIPVRPIAHSGKFKKKRTVYTKEEKMHLLLGLALFSNIDNNPYAKTISFFPSVFSKNNRNNINLKDLWRTLKQEHNIKETKLMICGLQNGEYSNVISQETYKRCLEHGYVPDFKMLLEEISTVGSF
mmetsp:Transcript_3562/g.5156  ORF Transcript_3562/g.5156 Transcript_3562/m.5156 type:complete len:199 (-) Transcript_3562:80-676(-)